MCWIRQLHGKTEKQSELKLPVLVHVTSGYKEDWHSEVNFLHRIYQRFNILLDDHQVVTESKFGVVEVYGVLDELEILQVWIP